MDVASSPVEDAGAALLRIYADALPRVYGYLLSRCGHRADAEELTSETFLAAADAARRATPRTVDVAWLIGIARHKLADHWRRQAREERRLQLAGEPRHTADDPWEARLDALRAAQTLRALAPQYRLALTLRYVDDLPVEQVAELLHRTLHATEALLVRARAAFRAEYTEGDEEAGDDA